MPKGRRTSRRIWLELFFKQVTSSPGCLPCLGSQGRLVVGVELVQGAGLPGTSARYGVQENREHTSQNLVRGASRNLGLSPEAGSTRKRLTTQYPPHQRFALCTLVVSWTTLVLTQ